MTCLRSHSQNEDLTSNPGQRYSKVSVFFITGQVRARQGVMTSVKQAGVGDDFYSREENHTSSRS